IRPCRLGAGIHASDGLSCGHTHPRASAGQAPRFEWPKHRPTRLAKPGEFVELPAGGFDDMDVVAKPTRTYSRRPPDGRPRTQPGPSRKRAHCAWARTHTSAAPRTQGLLVAAAAAPAV